MAEDNTSRRLIKTAFAGSLASRRLRKWGGTSSLNEWERGGR
jgi:hypothetical protein